MEIRAIAKNIRVSPRKVRLIADAIRNLSIEKAFIVLSTNQKRAADPLKKTLESAIANAVNNKQIDRNNLVIESILVDEGQALKRFHPSSRGRVHPYKKKSSHIAIVLKEKLGKVLATEVKAVNKKEEEKGEEK